jgi:hypothetical protein
MFKYKATKFIILLSILIILPFFFKFWHGEDLKSKKLLSNNITFTGVITDLKISRNHAFGVITLKVVKANTKMFLPTIEKDIYPYAIKDSVAEIYHYISPELKKGMSVELDSDKKNINFFDKNTFIYNSDIAIISSDIDIKFVQKNSLILR